MGWEVDEFLVKFPNKICPDGWPVTWFGTVPKLLVPKIYDIDISDCVIILKKVLDPIGFLGANLMFILLFMAEIVLSGTT